MQTFPDNLIDTIITDPPYGLEFMGKDWDKGVPGPHFWAEMFRICKPGASLLSFGGTRTYHRMACAIEDAGWQIRDCLMWLYGSGFPKSHDISKGIDKAKGAEREVIGRDESKWRDASNYEGNKYSEMRPSDYESKCNITAPATDLSRQWSGWGTALKPAWEPIIVAMKPLDGTFAANAEKWGVAGINVDGSRIGTEKWERKGGNNTTPFGSDTTWNVSQTPDIDRQGTGRWPANLLLDEEAAAMLDGQSGDLTSGSQFVRKTGSQFLAHANNMKTNFIGDSGGASRFFYVAKADRAERNEGCDDIEAKHRATIGRVHNRVENGVVTNARKAEVPNANIHPTVKPLDLMKYLCNLTRTPTGGIVLDPFCGSGTTLWAAEFHNRPWIGIEMNKEYVAIAEARIERERSQIKLAI